MLCPGFAGTTVGAQHSSTALETLETRNSPLVLGSCFLQLRSRQCHGHPSSITSFPPSSHFETFTCDADGHPCAAVSHSYDFPVGNAPR